MFSASAVRIVQGVDCLNYFVVGDYMKYRAIFLDFYGTLVHEDDIPISKITQKISIHSIQKNTAKDIASYWWNEFRQLFENSYGGNFKTQRELETISIKKVLEHFQCEDMDFNIDNELFDYWIKPSIFEDTMTFLTQTKIPICIVSNIDRNDILQAIDHYKMNFTNIITSEDANSYKPRQEIFQMALEVMKALPKQILHIGDSLSSDITGAHNCGIDSFWLNRKNKPLPDDCLATYNGNTLNDVMKALYI